ncbi:universal stress protein UspA-like protein [Aequorivita sublithincola DSM 14238]|uniref:Universal stress protein UspA-like protein n=1 Tax=Aequorivita sublithincola (strain DSM 14238 / LMG 21431 / ACAM 643 / 9-3) TaxID=746697 RepID=I3YRR7_AEQSU|nr:universal stress protein [Aequorivita sublithincola]AFL79685.1 universal stress protein UspA-like protein [Aequorivita sublithincola DSM 14238]
MKKILVPVDFSQHSDYALEVAAGIAKKQNAEIIALHMMGLSEAVVTRDESKEVFEAMFYMKLAEKRFAEFLDKDYLKGIKVTDAVHNYKVFSELNDVALDFEADLIVMGSHGSSGLKEVFVGSNTEKVVRTSEIPVLVIKHQTTDFNPQLGVFACDFLPNSITPYLKAKRMFDVLGIKMQPIYINLAGDFRNTREIEKRILTFMNEAKEPNPFESLNNVVQYNDYSVEAGIFAYSQLAGADIIALPTQGRQGLAHFFSGSIGEDVVNHSDLPVMTFKIS